MPERAVYSIMSNNATLAAVVPANRMFKMRASQKPTLPYIVFRRDDTNPVYSLAGRNELTRASFTIIGVSDVFDTVKSVETKIRNALVDQSGTFGGVYVQWVVWDGGATDLVEVRLSGGEGSLFEVYQEFTVWYQAA